ncbi:MAG: hypothetical protein IPG08_07945 [Sphingobacteriaceae bacterium]|nr:hypothetical protein [Sphingobacteriaceae bacterium]
MQILKPNHIHSFFYFGKRIALFALLFVNVCFSQNLTAPYSASYWSAYADKLQLTGKDRQEFLSSHKRMQTPIPLANTPLLRLHLIPPSIQKVQTTITK